MKGSYILLIKLKKNSKIRIGKLGIIDFFRGYYCYVGSALGKTINLERRVARHKRLNEEKSGRLKWHVDYFLVNPNASIVKTIVIDTDERVECRISRMLERFASTSIPNFGSSDCDCKGHLHYFKTKKSAMNAINKCRVDFKPSNFLINFLNSELKT
jgi:Uri superfamily endonuclease